MIARNRTRDETRRVAEPAPSLPGRPLSYEYEDRYARGGPSLAPPSAAYARGYENALGASSLPPHPSSYGGYSAPTRSALAPGPTPLLSLSTGPYASSFAALPGGRSALGPSPYPPSDSYAGRSGFYARDRYSMERERERDRDRERDRELWERRLMRFSPERFREREREFRPSSRERFRDVYSVLVLFASPPYSCPHTPALTSLTHSYSYLLCLFSLVLLLSSSTHRHHLFLSSRLY
jgi:hypothetical protein